MTRTPMPRPRASESRAGERSEHINTGAAL